METINQRIKKICVDRYEGKVLLFAKVINIPTSTVRGLCGIDVKGNPQSPKYDQLMSIYQATGVNMDWLMLGIGEMMPSSEEYSFKYNDSERTRVLQGTSVQDHDECDRLRAQNEVLSNSLSSIISQMQSLIDTNKRLTDLLINSSNACDIPTTD